MSALENARLEYDERKANLEGLQNELAEYQAQAMTMSVKVSTLKSSKAPLTALSEAMINLSAANDLLAQHENDIEAARVAFENAKRDLQKVEWLSESIEIAQEANGARAAWHDAVNEISNLLSQVIEPAKRCGEALQVLIDTRNKFLAKWQADPRRSYITDLSTEADLTVLLTPWPGTMVSSIDISDDRLVLKMPQPFAHQIFGILELVAKSSKLPYFPFKIQVNYDASQNSTRLSNLRQKQPSSKSAEELPGSEQQSVVENELYGESRQKIDDNFEGINFDEADDPEPARLEKFVSDPAKALEVIARLEGQR
jgi:flagellar biosynthesis chaperone FliJ